MINVARMEEEIFERRGREGFAEGAEKKTKMKSKNFLN
jgi:hypothetical protein